MKNNIKIIIVDDHQFFRSALKLFLSSNSKYQVIAEASNGKEFLKLIEKEVPDVVLMDINMPEMNGIEATRKAMEYYGHNIKIIAVTLLEDFLYLKEMIEAGASGFLNKNDVEEHLESSIKAVMNNKFYFHKKHFLNKTDYKWIQNLK